MNFKVEHAARLHALFIAAYCLGSALNPTWVKAASPDPTKVKKSAKLVKTDCRVVATEAKRIVPTLTVAASYSKELWERVSEDINPCIGICLFTLLNITPGRDVLSNAKAPSGPGWISDYIDSLDPTANQRHHFGFHFFVQNYVDSVWVEIVSPLWLPTTILTLLNWLVWRKTLPKTTGRAFPIEPSPAISK